MKLKKLILSVFSLVAALTVSAQGIEFMPEGSTFAQAVEKAQKENKNIFLDCYTSWCGPCKMMANKIFPMAEVGEYMNPRFVAIKIDMEKGEGPELASKLEISAYPTFIIFDKNGKETGRFLGGSDATNFLARVKAKSEDNGMAKMNEQFEKGDRDPKFLREYLAALSADRKNAKASQVAGLLLEGKAETFANDSNLVTVFMTNIGDPFAPSFQYTVRHPEALTAAIGERNVNAKIHSVINRYPRTLIRRNNGNVTLDEKKLADFCAMVKECNLGNPEHFRLSTLISYNQARKDWNGYVAAIAEYTSTPGLDAEDMSLCRWTNPVMKECQDPATRTALAKILQQRLDDIRSGKREAQTKQGNMTLSRPVSEILEMLVSELNGEKKTDK